MSIAKSKQVSF